MKTKLLFFIIFILLAFSTEGQERFRSGIFLHHSTGANIWGPNGSSTSVPDEIVKYNTEHSYTGDDACTLNENWFPDNHGNEWADWHQLFDGNYSDEDLWSFISSNKIVMIKSCFPSSAMTGWGEPSDTASPTRKSVFNYKWHWWYMLKIMEDHPENFFVIWTNAPLVAGATTDDQAYWSNVFCTWAKDTLAMGQDPEYGSFPKNVYVFDFFHKLAGEDHKLKSEYAVSSGDSHPNSAATELVAPQLVKEVFDAAIAYENYYNGILQPPDLKSPENDAVNVPLDAVLQWNTMEGTTGYHLQVSVTTDFSSMIVDSTVDGNSFAFPGDLLTNDVTYYWRVSSLNSETESIWSDVWSFHTEVATNVDKNKISPDVVIYPNPSDGIINIKPGLFSSAGFTVDVFNASGQHMKSYRFGKNEKQMILHMELFEKGFYILKIHSKEFSLVEKIFLKGR